MSQTHLPRLAVPVERTITGGPSAEQAGIEQSWLRNHENPFADEGDE
ncbi:hypothetical protein ACBR40_27345 [Nonomuraea sp. AD125B]